MNYFVLFSVIVIAACVVVLLLPSKVIINSNSPVVEGLALPKLERVPHPMAAAPTRNASSAAGAADGSSGNDYLLNNTIRQQTSLAEAFENRDNANKATTVSATTVSATTTKKKGIASTGASISTTGVGRRVTIPKVGCDTNKCTQIDPANMDQAFQGNCVNPKYDGSDHVNYGIKHCPAFQPKDGAHDEPCLTCGYYEYKGICTKKDPNKDIDPPGFIPTPENPSNCEYKNYNYVPLSQSATTKYWPGPIPGANDDSKGADKDNDKGNDDSKGADKDNDDGKGKGADKGADKGNSAGPSCSTCELILNKNTQCMLPGCYSDDDGYLPFPDNSGYNFAEGCFYYNPDPSNPGKILPGMEGRPPGYYCPPITQGNSYDGGSTGDPCYTKQNPIPNTAKPNGPNYILDYAKFVKMDKTCSNDKPTSKQNCVPGKDDDNDTYPSKTTINHQHQHSGAINVYHHSSNQNHGQGKAQGQGQGQVKRGKQGQYGNSNTYMDPVGDTTVLGYL